MKEVAIELNIIIERIAQKMPGDIDWNDKPSAEKWSKKEILGHLTDSAQVNLQRFVRCTYQENFKLVYEQDEWVRAAHYQQADITDIFNLWRSLNRQIVRVLTDYPADRLQAKCDTSRFGESYHSIEWIAQDYNRHLKHHLNQIYGAAY